jgi:ABC-type sugar transport system ATPase subunit
LGRCSKINKRSRLWAVQGNEQPMITLDAVGKNYSGAWVLKDASFSISRGEIVALVGENGAGKSTLKNILCGLVAPDVGSIVVEGKGAHSTDPARRPLNRDRCDPPELSLFPNLSIAENVHMGGGVLPKRLGLV